MSDAAEDQRRETLADTLARWTLDGMLPIAEDLVCTRAYVVATTTLEAIIEETIAEYRA